MSSGGVARFLVENHAWLARVVAPTAVAAGFSYTAIFQTTPWADLQVMLSGEEARQPATTWRASARLPSQFP